MQILVATDGALDPQRAADAVARWHEDGDEVTVFTAMNVPTDFVDHLGDPGIKKAVHVALEAGQGIGDRAAEQLVIPREAPNDNPTAAPVVRSLATTAKKRTEPIVTALNKRGIKAKATWATTDNKTAQAIIAAIKHFEAGVVVIGGTGHGRFEGLLGSTGTKLVRQAPTSVLVLRD